MELLVTKNGEEHGLVKTVANSVKKSGLDHLNEKIREKAKKEREDDAKIVKARYINYIGKNERLTKPYCRWAGDNIQTFHLIPDNVYDLPKGFVKEVNDSLGLMKRSEILDAKGEPLPRDEGYQKIHQLVPVSF